MSLTQFIKRPAIREAFKAFAIRERTPHSIRGRPLLVPNAGGHASLVGTAFDYLARFHLARKLHGSPVKVAQRRWISEIAEKKLEWICASSEEEQCWREALAQARIEAAEYIRGSNNLRDLVDLSQYLAQLDFLFRCGRLDPEFRPLRDVSQELLELLEYFDQTTMLSPKRYCLLNPQFTVSDKVDGADADLVIDDRLIDLKTTAKLSVTLDYLLQLAGYAVLQRMGGISYQDFVHNNPFQSVEIYYARYGELVRWPLDELFPGDGFDHFREVFEAEITADELKRREWRRQYEVRRAERERKEQFDRDIARIRKPREPRALLRLLMKYKDDLGDIDKRFPLHKPLFTAVWHTIRAHGATAKRPKYKKYETIHSEIAAFDTMTDPLQLLRAFRRNEKRFVGSIRDSQEQNPDDHLVRAALLRAARRVIRNSKPRNLIENEYGMGG